jgi:hypothetical protein
MENTSVQKKKERTRKRKEARVSIPIPINPAIRVYHFIHLHLYPMIIVIEGAQLHITITEVLCTTSLLYTNFIHILFKGSFFLVHFLASSINSIFSDFLFPSRSFTTVLTPVLILCEEIHICGLRMMVNGAGHPFVLRCDN